MYAVLVLSHQVAQDGWQDFVDLTPGKGYRLRALHMFQCKRDARYSRCDVLDSLAKSFPDRLSSSLQCVFEAASECCGASGWLTTLPFADHGLAMPKCEFSDALCLCFGWQVPNLPQTCVCGKSFTVQHAFSCSCGGFPSIFHNELRNLTAELLSEVCTDVGIGPALQPLDSKPLQYATANREDGARLEVVARDFWGPNRQHAFFDIRVFNPFASSYSRSPLSQYYVTIEQEKRHAYDERLRGLAFIHWFFSACGGMGLTATTVYKKLASMLADKWEMNFSRCLYWMRCRLCFSLLRSAIMCLRVYHSTVHCPTSVAYSEGRLNADALE